MDSEQLGWTSLIVLMICVTIVVCFGITKAHTETLSFIENGYTRATIVGSDYAHWVKP